MKRLMRVLRSRTWTPILWLVPIALAACRGEAERSAVARDFRASGAETTRASADRAPGGGDVAPPARLRRLWTGGYVDFYASSVSPDGRWVTMIDWSTLDLAVRDLATDEFHHLTNPARGPGTPYGAANTSVFSRAGRQIAYTWGTDSVSDVRVADFVADGPEGPRLSDPRVVYVNPLKGAYYLWDWSPDGTRFLGTLYGPGNTVELVMFSTDGAPARTLKTFDWRAPRRAAFSPDGRYVAYDFPADSDPSDRDIYVVSTDGSRESRILDTPGHERLFGWHPDGSLLVYSDRGGTPGLWRLPTSDGKARGEMELLRADLWRAEPIGFADGAFYHGVVAEAPTLYVAELDLWAGRLVGSPRPIEDLYGGNIPVWAWSPDGRYLATLVRHPGRRRGGTRLVIRDAAGETASDLELEIRPWPRLRWAPDGESLVTFGPDGKGRTGFHRIDLESGKTRTLFRLEGEKSQGFFDLSSDGRTMYRALGLERTGPFTLVARDLESGAERRIGSADWPGLVALSPDETEIATLVPDPEDPSATVVGVMPVGGDTLREIFRLPHGWLIGSLDWTPDGRGILFAARLTREPWTDDLWLVPSAGGEARRIEAIQPEWFTTRLHPDGRRLAYKDGENRGEIWALEGATGRQPTHEGGYR